MSIIKKSPQPPFVKGGRGGILGFTLLEIMISLAILSVSLLALYSSVGNSLKISAIAEETDQAAQLGRQKMSEIMMGLDEEIARGAFPDEKEEHGSFDKPFERYRWSYTIKKVQIPSISPALGKTLGSPGEASSSPSPTTQPSGTQTTAGLEAQAENLAQIVTKKVSESVRELKLTISWGGESEEDEEKLVLITHLAKLK